MKFSFCLLILGFFVSSSLFSQKKWDPIFPTDDPYFKNWGWHAGLGANYSFPLSGEYSEVIVSDGNNRIINYTYNPIGRVGGMLEGGAFYLLDNYIVSYLDGGLRVNWFRGKEDVGILITDSLSSSPELQNEFRSFDFVNASLRLNANNVIQISQYGFIQNTLGLNFDYYFFESSNYSSATIPVVASSNEPFQIQLHYKLAYGFRLDIMHYMIIGADIPILGAYPWNDGKQTLDVFSSSYWPVTLSVQILFLRKSNRPDCKKPIPLDMNKKRKEAKMF